MSKYLDKEGYLREEGTGLLASSKELGRLERELRLHMKAGASLAEAVYCVVTALQTAADNIRVASARRERKLT